MSGRFPRLASLHDAAALRARLKQLGSPLPCDDEILPAPESPLARPLVLPPSTPGEFGVTTAPGLADPNNDQALRRERKQLGTEGDLDNEEKAVHRRTNYQDPERT